jgi:hypothetical protein
MELIMNEKKTIMKRSITAKAITIAAVTALALAAAPAGKTQGRTCSNATLKGTFSDKDTGFITSPPALAGPFAGVSLQTYDGNGTMTATGIVSLNGNIIPVTQTGTYTVNADCTGTYTVLVSPIGLTAHGFFVIDTDRNEIQILVTDPGTVITCIARRQNLVGDSGR